MPEINLLATIPEKQRYFATKSDLPGFRDEIFGLRDRGARLVVDYAIGGADGVLNRGMMCQGISISIFFCIYFKCISAFF